MSKGDSWSRKIDQNLRQYPQVFAIAKLLFDTILVKYCELLRHGQSKLGTRTGEKRAILDEVPSELPYRLLTRLKIFELLFGHIYIVGKVTFAHCVLARSSDWVISDGDVALNDDLHHEEDEVQSREGHFQILVGE
jgi:hypothetical protein